MPRPRFNWEINLGHVLLAAAWLGGFAVFAKLTEYRVNNLEQQGKDMQALVHNIQMTQADTAKALATLQVIVEQPQEEFQWRFEMINRRIDSLETKFRK